MKSVQQTASFPVEIDLSPTYIGRYAVWKSAGAKKGRGIFARIDIPAGAIIETSPVTIVPKSETDLFDDAGKTGVSSVIDQYLLLWQEDVKGMEYCLGHGFLMLYNHAAHPTAVRRCDYAALTMSMVALRDIRAGEEITFDYGFEKNEIPWFDIQE